MSQSVVDSPPPAKSEKKHKKDKKRSRDDAEDVPAVEEKKHKKSKSESLETETPTDKKSKKSKKSKKDDVEDVEEDEAPAKKEKKKSKKSKVVEAEPESEEEQQQEEEAAVASESEAEEEEKKKSKKSSKDKKEKKEKKDKKKQRQASTTPEPETATTTTDAMDVDTTTTTLPTDDADFPFYTQTHSLYVPFYPCGFDKPLTNVAAQHLEPLLNHYSPVLRGVLLSYTNLNLSERPVQASVFNPPTDETPALLRSVDEYAVGFAYLTFDAHMFKPSRGKWMEGVVQLQSEGHIGVQCWGRFNASIEAKRLPKGWKWVDLKGDSHHHHKFFNDDDEEKEKEQAEEQEEEEEDQLDGEELQVVEQVHTTGYWVDASGKKVSGKVRFRIKNFDVGLAGDYGYLSLEGTFLNDDEERALQQEEREAERKRRSRQNPGGLLRPMSRRVPEFSMTKFGKEEEEEDAGQRTVFAKVTGKEGDVTPDD